MNYKKKTIALVEFYSMVEIIIFLKKNKINNLLCRNNIFIVCHLCTRERVTFARASLLHGDFFARASLLHEWTILHGGSLLHEGLFLYESKKSILKKLKKQNKKNINKKIN